MESMKLIAKLVGMRGKYETDCQARGNGRLAWVFIRQSTDRHYQSNKLPISLHQDQVIDRTTIMRDLFIQPNKS